MISPAVTSSSPAPRTSTRQSGSRGAGRSSTAREAPGASASAGTRAHLWVLSRSRSGSVIHSPDVEPAGPAEPKAMLGERADRADQVLGVARRVADGEVPAT